MKVHRILLPVVGLFLIYSNHAASQQDKQESPAAFDGRGFPSVLEISKEMAEKGDIGGQFQLGSMYADGRGITQDYLQAYMWLTLSMEGSTDKRLPTLQTAADLRDSLAKKMMPQQIEEAERLAKEWESKYVQRRGDGPFSGGSWGVTAPVILVDVKPPYTTAARQARVVGDVIVTFIVRKDGTTDSFKILKGLGYGLDESSINTIKKDTRFKPGAFQGKPADVQILMAMKFRLY